MFDSYDLDAVLEVSGMVITPEDAIEFFEELEMSPLEVMAGFNRSISNEIRADPNYDPMKDFRMFIPCLAQCGLFYDPDTRRFEEVDYYVLECYFEPPEYLQN
ncbi:hypothetical protein KY360_04835 [Candidatus Woesearchaeota archaeon]|nr:hypothetical protein [Candidatus Woesearchaeota archaeon]